MAKRKAKAKKQTLRDRVSRAVDKIVDEKLAELDPVPVARSIKSASERRASLQQVAGSQDREPV